MNTFPSETLLRARTISAMSELADYHCRTRSRAALRTGASKRGHAYWVTRAINDMVERDTGNIIAMVY
jgi:hypothetical protein